MALPVVAIGLLVGVNSVDVEVLFGDPTEYWPPEVVFQRGEIADTDTQMALHDSAVEKNDGLFLGGDIKVRVEDANEDFNSVVKEKQRRINELQEKLAEKKRALEQQDASFHAHACMDVRGHYLTALGSEFDISQSGCEWKAAFADGRHFSGTSNEFNLVSNDFDGIGHVGENGVISWPAGVWTPFAHSVVAEVASVEPEQEKRKRIKELELRLADMKNQLDQREQRARHVCVNLDGHYVTSSGNKLGISQTGCQWEAQFVDGRRLTGSVRGRAVAMNELEQSGHVEETGAIRWSVGVWSRQVAQDVGQSISAAPQMEHIAPM